MFRITFSYILNYRQKFVCAVELDWKKEQRNQAFCLLHAESSFRTKSWKYGKKEEERNELHKTALKKKKENHFHEGFTVVFNSLKFCMAKNKKVIVEKRST